MSRKNGEKKRGGGTLKKGDFELNEATWNDPEMSLSFIEFIDSVDLILKMQFRPLIWLGVLGQLYI